MHLIKECLSAEPSVPSAVRALGWLFQIIAVFLAIATYGLPAQYRLPFAFIEIVISGLASMLMIFDLRFAYTNALLGMVSVGNTFFFVTALKH